MLNVRVIPCLDVKDGRVVKGVRFQGHTDMGDASELAARYRDQGADELVFYDITASPEGRTLDWIVEAQTLGAGEIVLNCMDEDGVRRGYDIAQLATARACLTIPLVASGGAGAPSHFLDVFEQADVSGALAASVFHTGALTIPDLKASLSAAGQEMRL